jgi:hypothetical protein
MYAALFLRGILGIGWLNITLAWVEREHSTLCRIKLQLGLVDEV